MTIGKLTRAVQGVVLDRARKSIAIYDVSLIGAAELPCFLGYAEAWFTAWTSGATRYPIVWFCPPVEHYTYALVHYPLVAVSEISGPVYALLDHFDTDYRCSIVAGIASANPGPPAVCSAHF